MTDYITVAGTQYYTTKETIKHILENNGFKVSFKPECISGRFRSGYYTIKTTHSFKCMLDKVRASQCVKKELDLLDVV